MPLEAMTEDEFHREFNTNVLGPLLVIRESLKHFGPHGGSVINIGSGASRMYPPGYSIYAASKGGLDAVTGVLAKELAPRKIRVNSINPGATLSEGTQAAGLFGVGSEFEKQLVALTPLGRIGTPADIAKVAVFLASNDSGWLTGEIILASGGLRLPHYPYIQEPSMPAYMVFIREKTLDQSELEAYWSKIPSTLEGHPIKVLAAYGRHVTLEGPDVEGVVVAEFPVD